MNASPRLNRGRAVRLAVGVIAIAMGVAAIASAGLVPTHLSASSPTFRPADSPPTAPTGLAATVVSASEIDLTWTNPSGELTDNTVYTSVGPGCGAGEGYPDDLGSAQTAFDATGLTADTTYSWTVTASNLTGEGPGSDCVAATTLTAPPSPPTGLTATTVSDTEIDLSWTNPAVVLTDNTVYTSVGSGCGAGEGFPDDLGSVVTSFDATGLTPGTTYSWTVTASNASGESVGSNCIAATTLNGPPSPPTGLTATTVSDTEIDLSWTNPAVVLTDNTVYTSVGSGCGAGEGFPDDLGSVVTSFDATGLAPGTTYSWTVTVSSLSGESVGSNCASATTLDAPVSAPTGLTATTISDTEIDLSWTNPSGTLTDNTVYTSIGADCGAGEAFAVDLGSVVTSFDATGLTPGTTYSWTVTASSSSGQSGVSNCASATTLNDPPLAPTELTATAASHATIELAWTNPSGLLTANTVYEYSSGCSALLDTYFLGVEIAYSVTSLSAGTTYCFTVSASTNGGEGPQSANASATATGGGITGGPTQNPAGGTAMGVGTVFAPSSTWGSPAWDSRTISR